MVPRKAMTINRMRFFVLTVNIGWVFWAGHRAEKQTMEMKKEIVLYLTHCLSERRLVTYDQF